MLHWKLSSTCKVFKKYWCLKLKSQSHQFFQSGGWLLLLTDWLLQAYKPAEEKSCFFAERFDRKLEQSKVTRVNLRC